MTASLKKIPVRHIGIIKPICGRKTNSHRSLREDLGLERYKMLGVKERFANESMYRICSYCLIKINNKIIENQQDTYSKIDKTEKKRIKKQKNKK